MTRAPMLAAICRESSVLPLSATIISPTMPHSRSAVWAFSMHVRSVSASFKQGITTETSIGDSPVTAVFWSGHMNLVFWFQIYEILWKNRSEEHTSELQSLRHLVCRLLLQKKKTNNY